MNFAPGAWKYALVPLLGAFPALIFSPGVTAVLLALAGAVLYFYRDPERTAPVSGVAAPADGKVSVLREEDGRVRVGVFMNVWDVHVNRAPMGGTVETVEHVPGAHRPAFAKESDRNERVRIAFEDYEVTLVAGAFARRIHPYLEADDAVERGDRIGHISFGSRADVLLPPTFDREDVVVERGEKVTAGETVIARRGGDGPVDEFDAAEQFDAEASDEGRTDLGDSQTESAERTGVGMVDERE
ncbi:phosphatidylserine decarboxylase [Natronoarchaeum philippinense]|uniref:Phosphatidylserine decarboxylase n=1 Tax=Natronoarchaeum philippinense TaxID=558529 RepID=A0A285N7H6_NATPI|nr:protein sorting system archaetidylserine decarboxylase [Natronoarchaeum philippinense]SNZ04817.1 phosphatidylserine decarboxylase [Natronoarchaeum philippinense]